MIFIIPILLIVFLKDINANPGLTGWAQVNGLRGATPNPDIMKRRMEFDLWYLKTGQYFWIIHNL